MLDFSKNYFELFGLPVGFVLDGGELASRYRELQRVVHPDRYANASDHERRMSMQAATRINEAFQVLREPIGRGRYLLSLHGIDVDAEKDTTTDAAFLMQQMELREELESARDQANPYQALGDLMARITASQKRLTGQLALQLEAGTSEQLELARETLRKMQFLQKLREQAEQLEAELDEEAL
jgi:molecular chaperone HscB